MSSHYYLKDCTEVGHAFNKGHDFCIRCHHPRTEEDAGEALQGEEECVELGCEYGADGLCLRCENPPPEEE